MSTEIKVPELGESITEGTIASWVKQEGEQVSRGDVLAELETDKVNLEISAEDDGVLSKILKQPGDVVEIGEVIGLIEQGGVAAAAAPAPVEEKPAEAVAETPAAAPAAPKQEAPVSHEAAPSVLATPAARKWAREHGKDLSAVATNDPVGRIRKEDVQRPQQEQPAASGAAAAKPASAQDDRPAERIPMTRRRQTIAKRLVQAQHEAAMLTTFNEVDMTAIMNLRKRRNPDFEKTHGIKIGFMSFFTKAVVGALKAFPLLNAEIDGDELVVKSYYDIGIAVSAKEGLVVPNLRNADRLSFAGIEHGIKDLAEKARENKLKLDDLQGGTFTITNGGIFGSMLSTPILNPPQVGILGMHNIQLRPVAIDEERMENRPMMYIALSYDHRIVDGRDAVQFLVRVKNLLEDPESLLLEG